MELRLEGKKNGPILVPGPATLKTEDGQSVELNQSVLAFCRCGHSQKKPWCDGSHKKADFQASAFEVTLRAEEE